MGMSLGQMLGYEEMAMCEIARQYVKGQPLVSREEETHKKYANVAQMVHDGNEKEGPDRMVFSGR